MTQFDTGLPSVRLVQGYVKDRQEVEVKLVTDDRPTLLWRQSLVYLKPKA
jgi:host factor-I protein